MNSAIPTYILDKRADELLKQRDFDFPGKLNPNERDEERKQDKKIAEYNRKKDIEEKQNAIWRGLTQVINTMVRKTIEEKQNEILKQKEKAREKQSTTFKIINIKNGNDQGKTCKKLLTNNTVLSSINNDGLIYIFYKNISQFSSKQINKNKIYLDLLIQQLQERGLPTEKKGLEQYLFNLGKERIKELENGINVTIEDVE